MPSSRPFRRLIDHCAGGNAIFTRFVTADRAEDAKGSWQRYYRRWSAVTRSEAGSEVFDLHPDLAGRAAHGRIFDKTTHDAFHGADFARHLEGIPASALILSGIETDVCVLATALSAVDLGYRTVIAVDAGSELRPCFSPRLYRARLSPLRAADRAGRGDRSSRRLAPGCEGGAPVVIPERWGSWNADLPAEVCHLPSGFAVTPVLYAASENRASRLPPGEHVVFGPRAIGGGEIRLGLRLAGTRLDWRYRFDDAGGLAIDWRSAAFGEWGLRFLGAALPARRAGDALRFGRETGRVEGVAGAWRFALGSAKAPLLVTVHRDLVALEEELADKGYFYLGSRAAEGPFPRPSLQSGEAPEMRGGRYRGWIRGQPGDDRIGRVRRLASGDRGTLPKRRADEAPSRPDAVPPAGARTSRSRCVVRQAEGSRVPAFGSVAGSVRAPPTAGGTESSPVQEGPAGGTRCDRLEPRPRLRERPTVHRPQPLLEHPGSSVASGSAERRPVQCLDVGSLRPRPRADNLEAVFVWQTEAGNFPCLVTGNDAWLDRSQPPIAAFVVWTLFARTGDQDLLERAYPPLLRESSLVVGASDPGGYGPARLRHLPGGRRRALQGHQARGQGRVHHGQLAASRPGALRRGERPAAAADVGPERARRPRRRGPREDGGGPRARRGGRRARSAGRGPPGANRRMAVGRGAAGVREPPARWPLRHPPRAHLLLSAGRRHRHPAATHGAGGAIPAPRGQVRRPVRASLRHRDDPAYGDNVYWRGRIWGPLNFWVYQGLRRAGLDAEAAALAEKSRRLFALGWRERRCGENYHAETGAIHDQPDTDGFYSWGALLPALAVSEHLDFTPWAGWSVMAPPAGARVGPLLTPSGPCVPLRRRRVVAPRAGGRAGVLRDQRPGASLPALARRPGAGGPAAPPIDRDDAWFAFPGHPVSAGEVDGESVAPDGGRFRLPRNARPALLRGGPPARPL